MSTSNQKNDNDWGIWIAIVILFAVGLWPISLILLARKLLAGDKSARKGQQAPTGGDRVWQTAEQVIQKAEEAIGKAEAELRRQAESFRRTAGTEKAASEKATAAGSAGKASAGKATDTGSTGKASAEKAATTGKTAGKKAAGPKIPGGRGLTIAGSIVAGLFGLTFLSQLLTVVTWGTLAYHIFDLGMLLGFVCLGLVLLFCGLARARKAKRLRKYFSLIGTRRWVSIAALARTTGARRRKVLDDLQDMLDRGLLPTGYLDLSRDLLILSEEGIPDEEPRPEPEPPQDDNAILAQIRAVNDAIPDPVMSAKIDRIGEITGKILDYQRQNPGRDSQLRSFLNYYLPTTLKILNSYAQLDAQGVEGENISAAKARIEGMMDKVVAGFENQLDQLFRDSAMDISSDVAVLEQMLEKDGLSGQNQGMTL